MKKLHKKRTVLLKSCCNIFAIFVHFYFVFNVFYREERCDKVVRKLRENSKCPASSQLSHNFLTACLLAPFLHLSCKSFHNSHRLPEKLLFLISQVSNITVDIVNLDSSRIAAGCGREAKIATSKAQCRNFTSRKNQKLQKQPLSFFF